MTSPLSSPGSWPASELFDELPDLPYPGGGQTIERFRRLWATAERSPSLGRLLEAHHDAKAILAEAGVAVPDAWRFGVWAAGGPKPLVLEQECGRWRLHGEKAWCTGASLVSHALVSAGDGDSSTLVLVDMSAAGIELLPSSWMSPAFADIDTRTVAFDITLGKQDVIGAEGWYLHRPGFWHGAVGVAACWAGCASGLVQRVVDQWRDDPHALAHLGAIDADIWTMRAVLARAAAEIDADPFDSGPFDSDNGFQRALRVRHIVDTAVADITTRLTRAIGPGPLAHQPELHTVLSEVDLYRRQCHAERDLQQLGTLRRDSRSTGNTYV